MGKEREQMDIVLGKHGWHISNITKHGPLHIKYSVIRIADGRRASLLQEIPELLLEEIRSDEMLKLVKEAGMEVNPFIALRLLLLVRSENKRYPPET